MRSPVDGSLIAGGRDQGGEDAGIAGIDQEFRVPLHAQAEAVAGVLDALDHAVFGHRIDHAAQAGAAHGLMVGRVHLHFGRPDDAVQQGAGDDLHGVSGLMARVGLLVRQRVGHGVRDVLDQRAAQRHRQELLAAADAEHRQVARQCAAQQRQFGLGAGFLQRDGVVAGAVAVQRRIDIEGAAGDDQRVDAVEQIGGQGWQMRQATGRPPAPAMASA